jgi:competence protein ComEC
MQDKIFYASCFGFILGVLLRSFLLVNLYVTILIGVIALAFILFFTLISKNNWGIIFAVFILIFSFGILRFQMVDVPAPSVFESEVDQKISFLGKIIDEPTITENNQKLIVEILAPQGLALDPLKARPFPAKTEVLATVNLDEDFRYGDEINFEGTLKKPANFITDQGKEFDYVNYLRKDGIFYVMSYPKIEIISHGNGNFIKNALFYAKDKFLNKMNLAIREPESLLMGGLILGEKSSFDESLRQSFVDTGTIHIVALSGYNVTIVAEWIMKIFSFSSLPKNLGIGAGIITILLFVLMTGGSSTAVRAGIMASLALFSCVIGRNYDVARALILAGVLMILINPFILVFDVSFQLSFIATVAVIFFAPKIEKYFLWITPRFKLRDIISVTCAAYIFVLPFILYKMGNLSLVALPANALILPFIPITMILGFLTGFAGIVWYALAVPLGLVSQFFLHYELAVISFFSNIPFAALSIPNFPFIFTFLIYVYFIYRLFGKSIKKFFLEDD